MNSNTTLTISSALLVFVMKLSGRINIYIYTLHTLDLRIKSSKDLHDEFFGGIY